MNELKRAVEWILIWGCLIWFEREDIVIFVIDCVGLLICHHARPVGLSQLLHQNSRACVAERVVKQSLEQCVQGCVGTPSHESNRICCLWVLRSKYIATRQCVYLQRDAPPSQPPSRTSVYNRCARSARDTIRQLIASPPSPRLDTHDSRVLEVSTLSPQGIAA